ncbi:alpha/beta-hydrolase [Fragilariopsis cylindrus CCMP1102]|uniref:Alpha/beta-hydrolase n=1 Tax=Fragilariopsis cylindrus CCMP1102 TaxID=635003 RepID=A0A1E7ES64_9STRA|nr:alpha/beta-hydrolase [Fragilariopsis cylindrus CCMP1102]|eukprot:OEU08712.1 alpha/beta-hydrolase [Fragilariopsis cylindrus CCMP1102]
MTNTKRCCKDCQTVLGRSISVCSLWDKNDFACDECKGQLCSTCYGKRPLIIGKPDDEDGGNNDDPQAGTMKQYCKSCFEIASTIDFSKTYDTIPGGSSSDIVWVFSHGASGCRQLFAPQAKELKKRYGHSSISWDLPGHGSMVDTPLTLESSKETLTSVLKENESWTQGKKLIYVGASLGAYIGYYLLEHMQDKFVGAVLMDAGQNVGPGASFKAKMGLVVLKMIGCNFSNSTMMQLMLGEMKKSKADYHLIDAVFGAGMFFEHTKSHVECLKTVAPADHIPTFQFPILFINGSEDYRDSEDKWLALCTKKDDSELKVYERGDHFFMHDSRFIDDLFTRMDGYSKTL